MLAKADTKLRLSSCLSAQETVLPISKIKKQTESIPTFVKSNSLSAASSPIPVVSSPLPAPSKNLTESSPPFDESTSLPAASSPPSMDDCVTPGFTQEGTGSQEYQIHRFIYKHLHGRTWETQE